MSQLLGDICHYYLLFSIGFVAVGRSRHWVSNLDRGKPEMENWF
jgi:hypothetical protein